MKNVKYYIILPVAFLTLILNAQTEAGKVLIGGSSTFDFSISKEKTKSDDADADGPRTTTFDLQPTGGYFIIDNLAVGLTFPITLSSSKNSDDSKDKNNTIMIMPFGRYYFDAGMIKPFLQLSLGTGIVAQKSTELGITTKQKFGLLGMGIDVGGSVFLNETFAIDCMLGYYTQRTKPKTNNDNNIRYTESGIGFSAGVSVFF